MFFYFTMDTNDGHINENADVYEIEAISEEQAVKKMADIYADCCSSFNKSTMLDDIDGDGENCWKVSFDLGDFSDCWIKTSAKPQADDVFDGIPFDKLTISPPGTHPGGNIYWLTADIYMPHIRAVK